MSRDFFPRGFQTQNIVDHRRHKSMLTALLRVLPLQTLCHLLQVHTCPRVVPLWWRSYLLGVHWCWLMAEGPWRHMHSHQVNKVLLLHGITCLWGRILPLIASPCFSLVCIFHVYQGKTCRQSFPHSLQVYGLSPRVSPLMDNELLLCSEGFPTVTAFKGFLSCVNSLMFNETWTWEQDLHSLHTKGVFPVWISDGQWGRSSGWSLFHIHCMCKVSHLQEFAWCTMRFPFWMKPFTVTADIPFLSGVVFWCILSQWFLERKALPQSVHW